MERLAVRLEQSGAALAAQFEIPIFGELFGLGEAVELGALPMIPAVMEGRAEPVFAGIVATIELHLSAKDRMARHKPLHHTNFPSNFRLNALSGRNGEIG